MTPLVETPDEIADRTEIADLLREYMTLVSQVMKDDGGPGFQVTGIVQHMLDTLESYLPPNGQVFLVRNHPGGAVMAMAFLRMCAPHAAEIKRVYVRPVGQGQGLGRTLTLRAMETAKTLGARTVLLDTLAALKPARALYEGLGFTYIDKYAESEIPPDLDPWVVFMRREL